MKIKILKTGKWALQGIKVVSLKEGSILDFGAKDNDDLVTKGWAEYHKEEIIPEPVIPEELKEENSEVSEDELEAFVAACTLEKGEKGWWSVYFEGKEYKVRAKSEDEAKIKAFAEYKGEK